MKKNQKDRELGIAYIQSFKGQTWLLLPSREDTIPESHICYPAKSLVESLDYTSFDIQYSGAGHPAILLKTLIMGMIGPGPIEHERPINCATNR